MNYDKKVCECWTPFAEVAAHVWLMSIFFVEICSLNVKESMGVGGKIQYIHAMGLTPRQGCLNCCQFIFKTGLNIYNFKLIPFKVSVDFIYILQYKMKQDFPCHQLPRGFHEV